MQSDEIDFNETADDEIGSDELLAHDDLRLPDSANILVRLHAVRAWLARRREEATIAVGEAALALQRSMETPSDELRPRRRSRQQPGAGLSPLTRLSRPQQALSTVREAQEQLSAFEEAQALLEECVAHTNGERTLVEYYLAVEQLLLDNGYSFQAETSQHSPWYDAITEVLHRIEHVGTPQES